MRAAPAALVRGASLAHARREPAREAGDLRGRGRLACRGRQAAARLAPRCVSGDYRVAAAAAAAAVVDAAIVTGGAALPQRRRVLGGVEQPRAVRVADPHL